MKMTTFIIGIIIASLFVTGFSMILVDFNSEYTIGYDETELSSFNKMDDIQTLTEGIKGRVENQTTDRTLADVIGGFIADGKDTLLISASSFDLFSDLTNKGMEKINAPTIFSTALYSIILILIFIGIILGAILGKEL